MRAFNSRIRPKEMFGLPIDAFYYGSAVLMCFCFGMISPFVIKVVLLSIGSIGFVAVIRSFLTHKKSLFLKSIRNSAREEKACMPHIQEKALIMNNYLNYYTWETPISDFCMGHHDGFVSCMIEWDGFKCEMMNETETYSQYTAAYKFLDRLEGDLVCENHFWREHDTTISDRYIENNKHMIRAHEVGGLLRKEHAENLSRFAWSNRVCFVLSKRIKVTVFKPNSKKFVKLQRQAAKELFASVKKQLQYLPGSKILKVQEYCERVDQSYNRAKYARKAKVNIDYRFNISEQLIKEKPHLTEDGFLKIDGEYSKVILFSMYPDAEPGWFLRCSSFDCAMHISQIIVPLDTRKAVAKQKKAAETEIVTTSKSNEDYEHKAILEREGFASFVADNGINVFNNAYIMHLHGKKTDVEYVLNAIHNYMNDIGGDVYTDADIQLLYWRVGQPGLGRYTQFLREDHTWQVANMMPAITYDSGIKDGEILRVTSTGQLVNFSYLKTMAPHSFTTAKTRSGKGVDKTCEIIETYPFGLNWYICEFGPTYRWVVEAFGGDYTIVDPNETIVNALPGYDLADSNLDVPLTPALTAGTIMSMAFLLIDGREDKNKKMMLTTHEEAAASIALNNLYRSQPSSRKTPILPDFMYALKSSDYNSKEQEEAGRFMHSNLKSFLDSSIGGVFKNEDNFVLTENITGVDLKPLENTNKKLLLFYLNAIAQRYSQMVFFRSDQPGRVLFDEIHVPVRMAPVEMNAFASSLARMGGKANGFIDLVTQGLSELEVLDEVISSTSVRNLLYRNDLWDDYIDRLEIPERPGQLWKSFKSPQGLNYRQGLRYTDEKYYDLFLKFTDNMLDIADTNPAEMAWKNVISSQTKNIFERIELLRKYRDKESTL